MEGDGMMEEMVIRINSINGAMTVEETIDGVVSRKAISPETLMECFTHSLKHGAIRSELLPPNTLSYAQDDSGGKSICLWHPELTADISYFGTAYQHFPLPRLVFGFSVSGEGKISSCRLGVVKNERLRPETPMYEYPFSNVSGFRLCTGSNPLPNCASLHTLASVAYLILAMPNNNDQFSPRYNKMNLEFRDLLELLKDKAPAFYYENVLLSNGKTLQDFLAY
jgi:hypothetical protein